MRHALVCTILLISSGCAARNITIADVLPKGAYASPWILEQDVWSGPFELAAAGLGEEAEGWRALAPQHAWLARYAHEADPGQQLRVRVFSFADEHEAGRAFEHFRPPAAGSIRAGDAACWTEDGILVQWGRLVLEIFGNAPEGYARPEQAVYLLACIEKRMPPALPRDPR